MIDDPLNRTKALRGQDCAAAKLTDENVRFIRRMVERRKRLRDEANRLSNKGLAKILNVHYRTVDRVIAGENWTHVEDEA